LAGTFIRTENWWKLHKLSVFQFMIILFRKTNSNSISRSSR